jgi:hypothetical protein
MLTAAEALRSAGGGGRRPPPSVTHLYHEYVMQRIEAFKNSVTRDELMRVAGEATAGAHEADDQLVLTELLTGEVVDQLIFRKLKLPTRKKFGKHILELRAAQKEPTHWGLDEVCPVVPLLPRLVPSDRALVVGSGAEACACLLAAQEVDVMYWASDLGVVERLEQRLTTESLAARCLVQMVRFGYRLPNCLEPFDLVVVDLAALAELDSPTRFDALRALQAQTNCHGLHVLLPSTALVPEAVFTFYDGWEREDPPRRKRGPRPAGCILAKPLPAEHRQAAGA